MCVAFIRREIRAIGLKKIMKNYMKTNEHLKN